MTKTVTIREAQTTLAALIELAEQGESIIIAEDDEPKAKLVPIQARMKIEQRLFGQYRGLIHIGENFDEPLGDDFWLSGKP